MSKYSPNQRAQLLKQQKKEAKAKKYSDLNTRVLLATDQKSLPLQTRRMIDKVNQFGDKPFVLRQLNHVVSTSSNMQRRVRQRISRVIITLLSAMDWSTHQIGKAKQQHFDTMCYDVFRLRYQSIFGEAIAERTFERDIRRLKDAGYYNTQQILTYENGKCKRGETCPKWFEITLFVDLGLSKADLLDFGLRAANALKRNKLSNIWKVWVNKSKKPSKPADTIQQSLPTFDEVPDSYDGGIFPDDNLPGDYAVT